MPLRPEYEVPMSKAALAGVYTIGSLINLSWYESHEHWNALPQKQPNSSQRVASDFVMAVSNNVRVYSQNRLFVVVRPRHRSCIALLITTYFTKGLTRNKISDREHNAHCIIYDNKNTPQLVMGEMPFVKDTIGVEMVSGETLELSARLCYSKPTPIEYDIKVKHMGQVVPEHLDRLLRGYEMEQSIRDD